MCRYLLPYLIQKLIEAKVSDLLMTLTGVPYPETRSLVIVLKQVSVSVPKKKKKKKNLAVVVG